MDTDKSWNAKGNTVNETITQADYFDPPSDAKFDDFLKRSLCENFTAFGITFAPAPTPGENWIDFVRGKNYRLIGCNLPAGAGYGAITAKGSIDGLEIADCRIENGRKYGLELGQFDNYWKPGRAATRRTKIVNTNIGLAPLIVELWDAETPEIINSNVILKRIPKWKWLPYFLFMFVYVRICGAKTS